MTQLAIRRPVDVVGSWAEAEVAVPGERFEAFYAETYPDLAGYCWTLVHDRELAQDIAQESFMRLFARWIKVREPRPYLFHIATNLGRDAWRHRSRLRDTVERLIAEPSDVDAGDLSGPFAVQHAVERLPVRYREVVLLHYFADLSVTDVAAAVRRPPGTVKRQLSEARVLLAPMLAAVRG